MIEIKLLLQVEGETEKTITVDKDEFSIGRLPERDLYLPLSQISRYHARLCQKYTDIWFIEDMGSTNGTILNELMVISPQKVHHGDIIRLGSVYLTVILKDNISFQTFNQNHSSSEGLTILRNAQDLQQQWIQVNQNDDQITNPAKAIARLKDLVNIAKRLNSVESIEGIFSQVQKVVFRNLDTIDRLALLIDVHGTGKLELINLATRNFAQITNSKPDSSWISRTICNKVFADQVAIQTSDAQMDRRFEGEQSILTKGIRSVLAVPLWDENKVVGVLYADANISFTHWHKAGDEDLSFFSALANLVASSVQRWLLVQKLRNEEIIRHKLERYHSPKVVEHMISGGEMSDARLTPVEQDISILFADIVGFTAMSERLTPRQISELLNAFFEEMLKEVFAVGGTLDKFIGDCIMAFFGAPELQSDHPDRAVAAAQGMLKRLAHLNHHKILSEPLQLRIAINSGKAVVGDVGSSQRVDYTALGTTINLASRMETICPPGECVISEATYCLLRYPHIFTSMGEHRFRGIDRPIQIYRSSMTTRNSVSV